MAADVTPPHRLHAVEEPECRDGDHQGQRVGIGQGVESALGVEPASGEVEHQQAERDADSDAEQHSPGRHHSRGARVRTHHATITDRFEGRGV